MIERYTIKFGPAVSQKQMQKVLDGTLTPDEMKHVTKLKARIELICDLDDLKKVKQFIHSLQPKPSASE